MKIFKGISLLVVLGLVISFTSCGDEEKSLSNTELVKKIINKSRESATDSTNQNNNINSSINSRAIVTITNFELAIPEQNGMSGTITLSGTFDNQTGYGDYNITVETSFANTKIDDVTLNGDLRDVIEMNITAEGSTINITSNGSLIVAGDKVSGAIEFNELQVQIILNADGNETSFQVLGGTVTVNGKDITAEITAE